MKDFGKKQQPLADKTTKTVNAPLGGAKQDTRQQPTGGSGGVHNIPKTPTTGGTAGTQRTWDKTKDQSQR